MSQETCASLVERGDPDRFLATMIAPPADRARLWPLYAFNLELARAAWASPEPLIAQMRLQFWRDVLAAIETGNAPPVHEVSGPLAQAVREAGLPVAPLQRMVESREWDLARAAFTNEAALLGYLDATAGGLTWLAARSLGAPEGAEAAVRDAGLAMGIARWLQAVPGLEARGRIPLVDGRPEGVSALARLGQERLSRARKARGLVPRRAHPALLAGWQTDKLLALAVADPDRVARGGLAQSEFARRGSLLWRSIVGRW